MSLELTFKSALQILDGLLQSAVANLRKFRRKKKKMKNKDFAQTAKVRCEWSSAFSVL